MHCGRTWDNHVVQAGIITFSCSIIKNGIEKFALKQPIFLVRSLPELLMNARINDVCLVAISGRPYVLRQGTTQDAERSACFFLTDSFSSSSKVSASTIVSISHSLLGLFQRVT